MRFRLHNDFWFVKIRVDKNYVVSVDASRHGAMEMFLQIGRRDPNEEEFNYGNQLNVTGTPNQTFRISHTPYELELRPFCQVRNGGLYHMRRIGDVISMTTGQPIQSGDHEASGIIVTYEDNGWTPQAPPPWGFPNNTDNDVDLRLEISFQFVPDIPI